MSLPIVVPVKEPVEDLKKLLAKVSPHHRPRLKMLVLIASGTDNNTGLANKTGASLRSVIRWKDSYSKGGLDALCSDKRGGDHRSAFDEAAKQKLKEKLHDPKDAFTSFGQAQAWIK